MGRKVAIVARHPKSRYLAPLSDKQFEIWTMSPFENGDKFTDLPRWDVFFEIHSKTHLEKEVPGAWDWLLKEKEAGRNVVMREDLDRLEVEKIATAVDGRHYLTCTPAFCIAYAIKAGDVEELHLYGCDMATDGEYAYERPCVEFWLGVAAGKGIKVYLPDECDLCNSPQLYGFHDQSAYLTNVRARGEELKHRISACESELEQKRTMMSAAAAIRGELDTIAQHENHVEYMQDRAAELDHGLKQLQQELTNKEAEYHMLQGCLEENKYHRKLI